MESVSVRLESKERRKRFSGVLPARKLSIPTALVLSGICLFWFNTGKFCSSCFLSVGGVKVSVKKGDLTSERVDAIVNPANNHLRHERGVAKAILDKGGKVIETESNKIVAKRKSLKDGDAVLTSSGKLPCKRVVHAVGPDFRLAGLTQSRILLRRACLNSLIIAQECKTTSIALPAIGSGSYGMLKEECAKVMFNAVEEFVKQGKPNKKTITDIRFVNIDDLSVEAFRTEFISRYASVQSRSRSHHDNSFGSANASAGHPFSGSNLLPLSPTSYSGVVRISTSGGTKARSFTTQKAGATGKTGSHFPLRTLTGREDEGKGSNAKYTNLVSFLTMSSDYYMCSLGIFL